MSLNGFDPGLDFPPDGAEVPTSEGVATFRDGTMPGWRLSDGRFAYPFDSLGLLLAQRWAANEGTR